MTRRSALLAGLGFPVATLTFPTGAYAAKEFWNERKPGDWTRSEVKELLTKSPWARDASITDNGQVGGLGVPRGAGQSRRSGSVSTGQTNSTSGGTNPTAKIQWKGIVRWESALPVREALKTAAPKDAKDFYILNVVGNLPSAVPGSDQPQDGASLAYLKEITKLEHKGDEVHLSRVELAAENEVSPAGTLFYFSRVLALALKDKEALFTTKIGPLDVKCKFALGEMLYRGTLEL